MTARNSTVHLALVAVQLFFGLHYLAAKLLLEEIPPRVWAPMRVTGGALLLLAIVLLARRRLPRSPRLLGQLAVYSVFGVILNQWLFVEGLARTSPGHSSILMTSTPVWTLLFAVVLGQERAVPRKVLSLGVATLGVLLVIRPAAGELTVERVVGDLMTLANALSYALFLVMSKKALARTDAISGTAVLLCFGAIGMWPLAIGSIGDFDPRLVSAETWWIGAFIIVFPTAGAYLLTLWALARVDSSLVAFFIYLQPLIAVGLSALLFGERLTVQAIAGAALVFLAVYLGTKKGTDLFSPPEVAVSAEPRK